MNNADCARMRHYLKCIAASLGFILAISVTMDAQQAIGGSQTDSRKKRDLRAIELLEAEWNRINEVSDADGKETLLADDSYHVGPSGRLYNKTQDIAAMRSSRTEKETSGRVLKFFGHNRRIRLYRNVAVVTVTGYSLSTVNGVNRRGGSFRAVHVWEKRDGRWQLVVDQVTGVVQ